MAGSQRDRTLPELFWFWAASGLTIACLPTGVLLVTTGSLSYGAVALVLVAGMVAAGLVLGFLSIPGIRGGRGMLASSESVYGRKGNRFPVGISYLILTGWCAISTVLVVYCIDAILLSLGVQTTDVWRAVILVLFVCALTVLAFVGYRFIAATQKWIALSVGIVCVILGGYALVTSDWATPRGAATDAPVAVAAGFVLVLTTGASGWWNAASDYSRYQRPTGSVRLVLTVTAGMVGLGMILFLGVILGARSSGTSGDNPLASLLVGFPTWLVLLWVFVVAVGVHAAALTNMFSATIDLGVLGVERRGVAIGATAALTLGAAVWAMFLDSSFYNWFSSFLNVLGVPLAAWAGTMLAALVRRVVWREPTQEWGWPAILILLLASIVGLGLVSSTTPGLSWVGYLDSGGTLTSAGVGIPVALVLALLGGLLPNGRRSAREAAAPT